MTLNSVSCPGPSFSLKKSCSGYVRAISLRMTFSHGDVIFRYSAYFLLLIIWTIKSLSRSSHPEFMEIESSSPDTFTLSEGKYYISRALICKVLNYFFFNLKGWYKYYIYYTWLNVWKTWSGLHCLTWYIILQLIRHCTTSQFWSRCSMWNYSLKYWFQM